MQKIVEFGLRIRMGNPVANASPSSNRRSKTSQNDHYSDKPKWWAHGYEPRRRVEGVKSVRSEKIATSGGGFAADVPVTAPAAVLPIIATIINPTWQDTTKRLTSLAFVRAATPAQILPSSPSSERVETRSSSLWMADSIVSMSCLSF